MVISFYYGGKLVGQTTTTCPEGCRLSLGQPGLLGGKLYGPEGLELVRSLLVGYSSCICKELDTTE